MNQREETYEDVDFDRRQCRGGMSIYQGEFSHSSA